MNGTKFTMHGVWRLRKAQRDACRMALAAAVDAQREASERLERIEAELTELQVRRRGAVGAGLLRLRSVQEELHSEELLRTARAKSIERVAQLAAERDARQAELAGAEADWRAIDWLRERRTSVDGASDLS